MASRSLNKVLLIGNLTRDPELRYTPTGAAVCTIGLATNRQWVTESGEKKEETEFHRVVAWNKLAELCSQLLTKGRKIYVEGRLRTNSWQGNDGAQRSTTEVVIEDMIILDSRRVGVAGAEGDTETGAVSASVSAAPIAAAADSEGKKTKKAETTQSVAQPAIQSNPDGKEEVNPDDIPF